MTQPVERQRPARAFPPFRQAVWRLTKLNLKGGIELTTFERWQLILVVVFSFEHLLLRSSVTNMASLPRRASLSHCAVSDCPQPLFKRGYCIDHFRTFNDAANTPVASDVPEQRLASLRDRFKALAVVSIDDQVEFFLKSFIFDLGDNWKDINTLEKAFRKRISDANEGKQDLNPIMAADFLQKSGIERTVS